MTTAGVVNCKEFILQAHLSESISGMNECGSQSNEGVWQSVE